MQAVWDKIMMFSFQMNLKFEIIIVKLPFTI